MNRTHPDPSAPARAPLPLLAVAALALGLAAIARADAPTPGTPAGPVLTLANGGVVPGVLADTSRPRAIGWQADQFTTPFDLPLAEVQSIRFPIGGKAAPAAGAFGFELAGGDVLFGALLGLDDQAADLDVARLGRVRIARERIGRIFRWNDGGEVLYYGPNTLAGWREFTPPKPPSKPNNVQNMGVNFAINNRAPGPAAPVEAAPTGPGWVEDGGSLLATRDGVTIQGDIGLAPRSAIEVELAWKRPPNFALALGVGDDETAARQAFRLEVWDGQIVALRETDKEADLAPIHALGAESGRARFQIFLDQEAGHLLVFGESGAPLADLKLGGRPGAGLSGVRLSNLHGDIRLERLRVARWDGTSTPTIRGTDPHVLLTDRTTVAGAVARYDAATHEFVVGTEPGATRVAADRISDIQLAAADDQGPPGVRVVYGDGTRIGGKWIGVEGGRLFLSVAGMAAPVALPPQGVRALEVAHGEAGPWGREETTGTLELNGIRMLGRLVDSTAQPGAGCLAWLPLGGGNASVIRPGASGRIVFHQPMPQSPGALKLTPNRTNKPGGSRTSAPAPASTPAIPRALYLRTGDIIPAEVTRIDEDGVWFKTPLAETKFVPNARIKAVELAADEGPPVRIGKAKLERLLTLPRMQKGSPPTHLIRSRNGDLLRGRIIAMDDRSLRVEVRLEERAVPRDRISRLIWFHADETDPSKKPAEPVNAAGTARVQAVRSDGIRLTFQAEAVRDGVLLGKSDVLGACTVKLGDVDQLLIGGMVEQEATQLAYQNFKLQNAPEPKSAQDSPDSPEGGAAGTESMLVGKPAPDFQLDLLGGGQFKLADHKGKVVVLDFWATWCGPCLQAMPQIDRATHAFVDQGVELVAVNLQETPAKITALLERQKLNPTVALDKSGAIAGKYGATAIPQTVVIDRDGKIARLFIGTNPHLEDQLREALQALVPAKQP